MLAGDINYQSTTAWYRPGSFLSPKGNVAPNPRTRTQPRGDAVPDAARGSGDQRYSVFDSAILLARTTRGPRYRNITLR